jgi:Carboxypeptidase regulatory-like domain
MAGNRLGSTAQSPGGQTYGGSTLQVKLVAQHAPASDAEAADVSGFTVAPDALPYPRLVRLATGEDYDEKINIHVGPAQTKADKGNQPVWGAYSFSVIYSADYSNAAALARDIHANLWQGEAASNTVTLELQPPVAQGAIAGTVLDSIGRPYGEALVTLSDDEENALDQLYSDDDGRFTFTQLPLGRYWLTVRQPGTDHDTSVFRHVDVSQAGSPATAEIMMLPVEIDKADRVLHKPVLFHIVDSQGHPLAKVRLAFLYSAGSVIENLKAQTGEDGFVAISLIPGGNFVTLRMDGCKDVQRTAGVAPGPGVNGFEFVYECASK